MLKKRIPSLLAIIILLVSGVAGAYYIQSDITFFPRANPAITPRQVKITNISENGFTVSWITQETTSAFIQIGTDPGSLSTTVVDERDQLTGESGQYRAHYVTVRGLNPATKYYFKLGSGQRMTFDNNGQPFELTTAPIVTGQSSPDTIYGTILTKGQTPADDTIVYASLNNSTPVSGLVKQSGNYAIPLSSARTLDLQQLAEYNQNNSMIGLLVQSGRGETSEVVVSIINAKPIPNIVVGETNGNLDELSGTDNAQKQELPITQITTGPESAETQIAGNRFSLDDIDQNYIVVSDDARFIEMDEDTTSNIVIDNLPNSGIVIPNLQPSFYGKAPPATELIITVNSPQVYTASVSADDRGVWQWQVPGNLSPGEHTLTVSYTDESGILQQVRRRFIVQAADGNGLTPGYIATPSASTPTPAPTLVPTTPVNPTLIPTIEPVRPAYPATDSGVPVAGSVKQTLVLIMIGVVMIGMGTIKMIWSKSNIRS